MRLLLLFAASLFVSTSGWSSYAASDFLATYCFECHDDLTQKGERRFDELAFPINDLKELIAVQEIIDQLNLEEMPPPKADQPTPEERAAVIAALTAEVAEVTERLKSTGGQTVLRRLNEREYLNTLEDLFSRRVDTFGPTSRFPRDQTAEHVDTLGDVLVTSGFLLDNYFEAADLVVEKALGQREKPEVKEWKFEDNFHQGQELSFSHKNVYNYRYLCVYEVPNTVNHEGGYAGLESFPEGVHADGIYEVRVLAHSMHRDSHYDPEIFRMDLSEPFRLGIVSGDARIGELHHPQPIEPQLGEVTVADGKPQWYTMRAWLEKGQQPRFIFPNGMANCRLAFGKIAKEYKEEWPKDDPYDGGIVHARRIVLQHGKMPHIRMHKVHIKGPIYEEWPPISQKLAFGGKGFQAVRQEEILKQFAEKAFRRPVTDEEIATFSKIAEARVREGKSPRQATMDAMKGILCSPSFLYLVEPGQERGGKLGAYDLATRISYFLTASMPDEALLQQAKSGEILKREVLLAEVERLLGDPASDEFVEGFLDSWLNIRALGDMPPDRSISAPYYYNNLETAMKEEVKHFFRDLLERNAPITRLIDSDYTFVNRPLAELYRIPHDVPHEKAYDFLRVSLPDRKRGGLLGMGAVLTVSANGIETSPIVRGIYLLENIMGTPPPPPPDEVPALEPDIRGATSIRDQLIKHREQNSCAECHRKIDPPGFALEHYGPIGRWREKYPDAKGRATGPKIDASGELPNGKEFRNVMDLKKLLLQRRDHFTHHLAERLLTYGTGRRMEALDRADIEKIAEKVIEKKYGARTLLREVVTSEIFLRR